jgi:hypothetical protein
VYALDAEGQRGDGGSLSVDCNPFQGRDDVGQQAVAHAVEHAHGVDGGARGDAHVLAGDCG